MIDQSAEDFERDLGEVAWFANLGQPSSWDEGCARFYAWDQWPGPEDRLCEALALTCQDMHDRIFAASPLASSALRTRFDRIGVIVRDRARVAVPFDARGDAWHGPTQCVWDAGYVAGLLGCVLASGLPVEDDLVELWNWFEAGHWPASFAKEPGDPSDIFENEPSFPRRLLVY